MAYYAFPFNQFKIQKSFQGIAYYASKIPAQHTAAGGGPQEWWVFIMIMMLMMLMMVSMVMSMAVL